MRLKSVINFLPDYCFSCNKKIPKNEALCNECRNKTEIYNSARKCALCNRKLISSERILCEYCSKLSPYFDGAIALYPYKDGFSASFSKMKFRKRYYKLKAASELMYMQFKKMNVQCDFIVPVPTALLNYIEREYCSSVELSHFIGKKCKLRVYDNMLKKKITKQQAKMKLEARKQNVSGKFIFNKKYKKLIEGKTVLLVDDVITSGATASECANVLKQNGAEYVYVLTLLYGGESRRERK